MAPDASQISSSSSTQGDVVDQPPNKKPGPIQKLSRMFSQSGRNSAASSAPPTPGGHNLINGSSSVKMGPPSTAPSSSVSPPLPPHLHLKTGNNNDSSSHGETLSSRPGSRDQTPLTSPASSSLQIESGYDTDRSGKGSSSTASRLKQKLEIPPRVTRGRSPSVGENNTSAASQTSSTSSIPDSNTTNSNNNNNNNNTTSTPAITTNNINNNNIATASTPTLQQAPPPPNAAAAAAAATTGGRKKTSRPGTGDSKAPLASPSSALHLPAFWNSMNPQSRPGGVGDRRATDSPVSTMGPPTPVPGVGKGAPADNKTASKRFIVKEDGSHEHVLRGIRRQEKLGTMLWELLGRKKEEIAMEGENLSLAHAWVDGHKNPDGTGEISAVIPPSRGSGGGGSRAQTPSVLNSFSAKYGKCQEVIGKGAFGIVRIAHKVDPSNSLREQLYAVKEFRKRPSENEKRYTQRLTSEFCISSSLRHPNIIHTLDLLQDQKGEYCEVMEYCSGGDLYTLILASGKGLEVGEADCFFKQLMRGVVYMHEMGVAHRDLKPENLLLTCRGALKITDFGNGECFRMAWESEVHMTNGVCGSAPYIAPEEYIEKEFDPRKVDVWATGVIYMAMRTGRHLWRIAKQHEDEFYDRYLLGRKDEGGYEPIEQLQREQCRNVIYSILDPISSRRITGKQVLNSEWGRQIRVCDAGDHGS